MSIGPLASARGTAPQGPGEPVLQARGLSKVYPGTVALSNVDFDVQRGSVNILIGENGAGKSTLMRILAGIESPTSGELFLDGGRLKLNSPRDAAANGIAMVHQELSLMPNLTIADNMFAGRELRRGHILIDETAQRERAAELLKWLDLDISPNTVLEKLAVGQQQLVEIARALAQRARVLILDEPTSALSSTEIRTLFRVIANLKKNGVAIVYISHRLQELLEIGDYFTILRDGQVAGTAARSDVSESWIVECMTGRRIGAHKDVLSSEQNGIEALRIENLTVEKDGRHCLQGVSLRLGRGEILGVYGLLGAGRTELFETIIGLRRESSGEILLERQPLGRISTTQRIRRGIYLVPEDRQQDGLIPDMSIRGNASLAQISKFIRGGVLSPAKERQESDAMLSQVKLKRCDVRLAITTLSGGNQQKTLLARALLTSPAVLLLDEPTRGVDVGAKAEIYALIRQLAANGLSVLFSCSDSQEIRELADRVVVLCRGVLTADFAVSEATDEKLLMAASGPSSERPEFVWKQ